MQYCKGDLNDEDMIKTGAYGILEA